MADLDDLSALFGQFVSAGGNGAGSGKNADDGKNTDGGSGGESLFGDIDLDTVMKLIDAFSRLNSSDKNTELLLALKPHLRSENQAKVDQAIRLMKLMSVLMLLRESGLADKLL